MENKLSIALTAADRTSMDRQLNEAVAVVREEAMREGRRGILVTRHSSGDFTVSLSDDVPFGLTLENQAW